jgi:hypothetical protein
VPEVVGLETALDLVRYTATLQKWKMTELLIAMQEIMETQIGSLASQMDNNQVEIKVNQAKTNADLR